MTWPLREEILNGHDDHTDALQSGQLHGKCIGAIRYLVVRYTGAPGTARNNGAYFASREEAAIMVLCAAGK